MSTGEERKSEGMALAEEAVPDWTQLAREAIGWLAEEGEPFTSEDLVRIVGLPRPGATRSNRNNAVGAVLGGAARRGVIRKVGYRNAQRPRLHAAQLAVWEGIPR